MALKLFNLNLILILVSCTLPFDKEIINYGPELKSFNKNLTFSSTHIVTFCIKKICNFAQQIYIYAFLNLKKYLYGIATFIDIHKAFDTIPFFSS